MKKGKISLCMQKVLWSFADLNHYWDYTHKKYSTQVSS